MLKVTSSPDALKMIKQEINAKHRAVRFGGSMKIGFIEIELDEKTADFIFSVIDSVRKRTGKHVEIETTQLPSDNPSITRKFLDGYFERRR